MDIILIAAMAANRVIGKDNAIPWHNPEELRFFKTTTMGHPVIMGRKTFASLKKPLSGRRNIVISRNMDFSPAGAERAGSLTAALALCADADKVFVIGGAQIFALAMPLATTILLTVLDDSYPGDIYFPEIPGDFQESSRTRHQAAIPFTVITYTRNPGLLR